MEIIESSVYIVWLIVSWDCMRSLSPIAIVCLGLCHQWRLSISDIFDACVCNLERRFLSVSDLFPSAWLVLVMSGKAGFASGSAFIYPGPGGFSRFLGEQGWRSGESARLPLLIDYVHLPWDEPPHGIPIHQRDWAPQWMILVSVCMCCVTVKKTLTLSWSGDFYLSTLCSERVIRSF